MERRVNRKIEDYLIAFKNDVVKQLQEVSGDLNGEPLSQVAVDSRAKCNTMISFVDNYENLRLNKDDFMKRKRVKSVVPIYDRCCAKRASGEQCTRRKKGNDMYCGTHIKGTPNSVMEEPAGEAPTTKNVKVDIWAQDIKGIIYYIDKAGNVYDTEDIMKIDKYPKRIIAKYVHDAVGGYSIPSIFGGGSTAATSVSSK